MFAVKLVYLQCAIFIMRLTITVSLSSCRDENNNSVDWFVIYKIPKLKDHSNPLIQKGMAYAYISSRNEGGWLLSNKSINDSTSMPAMTLKALYEYKNTEDIMYILYNDQPPVGNVSFTGGHTKGVVLAEKSGGFWLVHSVPHYPPGTNYSYPWTGLKNGQSYLCVTMAPDQLELVGIQLMYNYPHVFANSTPQGLVTQYPNLTKAALGTDVKTPPWYNTEPLVSLSGTAFQTFAKSPNFKKDLYGDWLGAALQVNLLVETWPNGPGRLNSSCQQPYRVENVDEVKVGVVGEAFSSHKDHSKWAISETKDEPWVCIGDINRAKTQAVRGGGTVCLKDKLLWQAYFDSVSGVESCPRQCKTESCTYYEIVD